MVYLLTEKLRVVSLQRDWLPIGLMRFKLNWLNVIKGFDLTLNPDDSTQILQVLKEYSLPLYLLALLFHGLLIPYRQRAVSHYARANF
jgi:hypothetical protein